MYDMAYGYRVAFGEDEGVGIAGDLGAGSLQLADLGSNGSVKLQFTVDLQFGVSLLKDVFDKYKNG